MSLFKNTTYQSPCAQVSSLPMATPPLIAICVIVLGMVIFATSVIASPGARKAIAPVIGISSADSSQIIRIK